MEIRKASKEDLVKIIELLSDDKLGKLRERFTDPLPETYHKAFEKIIGDYNQELMVMNDSEGKVIGCFQLTFIQYLTYQGGIRAQVEAVRISSEHRGKGLGESMITWAINRSKEKGAHVLQLTTDKQRPDSIRFYKKFGFIDSHEGMKLHFK